MGRGFMEVIGNMDAEWCEDEKNGDWKTWRQDGMEKSARSDEM